MLKIDGAEEYKIIRDKSSTDEEPRYTLIIDNVKKGEGMTFEEIRQLVETLQRGQDV